jgi:eukaryotic translation initiation factor 2C
MNLEDNPKITYLSLKDDFYDKFKLEKQNLKQFILCLNDEESIYNKIKTVSDIYIGIITQCALISKALKNNNKLYYKQLIFKIKSKLGYKGPEIIIPLIKNNRTIIFGADVTHYTHSNNIPSIASVVSTTNDNFFNHAGLFRYQNPRQEIIEKIDEMVYKLICNYKKINKYYPENIIFYRDGVPKNRFNHVIDDEINKIKKKLKQLNIDIKITFIIVQKRHNTRFFPIDKINSDKNGNCLPGIVIDTDICNENNYDFYLQSHRSVIGTSKPIHYSIIKNEINIKSNDIQQITYYLCYLYGRTSNSVSLVPAVYYAHILCSRARIYKESLTINKSIENTMFFI